MKGTGKVPENNNADSIKKNLMVTVVVNEGVGFFFIDIINGICLTFVFEFGDRCSP